MKVLQVEDIEKSKKRKKILKGLSFSVGEREIVGLLGPNGSGKSTTIKCISGLYRTDRGRIRICAAGILFLLGTARYGTGGQMLLVISEQGTQTVISIWSLVREEILGMLLYIVFLTAAVLLISFIVKTKMNALMICAAFCMTGIVQTTASDGTGKGIVEWLPQLSALTLLMLLAGCILIRIRED